jgi:sn-glycerol 3-phosphate transport system ATP-binding protein
VRPEHVLVVPAAQAMLELKVDLVEVLGADSYAYGTCGAADGASMVARLREAPRPASGDALPLRFDAARAHWFDSGTGKRVE